jgi:GAF domain-containing protein
MWVPLVVRDHVIGLLSITCPEPDGYTSRHAQLAQAIARQAAVAIDNARLHERARQAARHLEQRTRELAALYRADETLHRSLRVDDILQALVDEATEILGAERTTRAGLERGPRAPRFRHPVAVRRVAVCRGGQPSAGRW